jgi:radical SAM-linked protein
MSTIEKRLRLYYSKQAPIRFTSNLDVQKIWERTFRRAGISLSYSQGFHPQAKIQQASPLPLGFCGDEEIIDIWTEPTEENLLAKDLINPYLPVGIEIHHIDQIDPSAPSLQQFVGYSDYAITFLEPFSKDAVFSLSESMLTAESMLFTKHNGKQYDIKPLIRLVEVRDDLKKGLSLHISLSSTPSATGRPDHVLQYFHYDPSCTLITRQKIHFLKYD